MKHKRAVIFSTVMIFVVAAIVALGWLFRARYFIVIDVNGAGEAKSELYEYVNDETEKYFKGKWMFTFGEEQIKNLLAKNPYVEFIQAKKISPDKVEVTFAERVERFLIVLGGQGYITDENYNLLRLAENTDASAYPSLADVSVDGIDGLDFSSAPLGQKLKFDGNNLFGAMSEMFGKFTDKLNLIDSVLVDGYKNVVEFRTATGVTITVSFTVPTTTDPTEDDIKLTKERICQKTGDIEKLYDSLDEKSKRGGYIRVYEMEDHTVVINYEPDEN